ncbi:hypothetical protein EQ826_23870 [Ectopseudomonas mendocina]|nr:hypothetical protein [Pseudomonas mendocina]TRO11771.1 hypothetical protein EQ828_23475 [Pseudomonas mendocina]TRO19817.1 hypothetical protein EQ826_23870 [Pseudomonas mendocina]
MSRQSKAQMGYLMTEDLHNQVMQGIDSLRFLEGLASTAAAAPITPCFDLDDLAGYLQLLLEHTYKPLKSLAYERWEPAPRAQKAPSAPAAQVAPPAAPVELDPAEEEELLRNYRRLAAGDRQHLRRCAEALAFLVEKETDAG